MVAPFEKVTKKKVENNRFQFYFTLRKCFFFFCHLQAFYDFEVVKNIKTNSAAAEFK